MLARAVMPLREITIYPNVKAPRLSNREDWQRLDWVSDMVAELDSDRYFSLV